MNNAKYSGVATTNNNITSIAAVQHSEPTITLLGRVAGGSAGYVGLLGRGRKKDLHFTLIIEDSYTGIFGFDGQPASDPNSKPSMTEIGIGIFIPTPNIKRAVSSIKIKTNYYRNILPSGVVIKIKIDPPQGMPASVFASKLISKACGFADYEVDYSAPSGIIGETMIKGEHNSSSYIAGLLQSVMGYVPQISTPGYQTPGWDSPIPSEYFKDAVCK